MSAIVGARDLGLLLVQPMNPEPTGRLTLDRGGETLIGVAVGVAASVLTRERTSADAFH
jgi:hypothetical protein